MIQEATIKDVRAHGHMVMRRFEALLLAILILLIGLYVGMILSPNNVSTADTCQEDEAVWWVADDVRACVHYEDVKPLSQQDGR